MGKQGMRLYAYRKLIGSIRTEVNAIGDMTTLADLKRKLSQTKNLVDALKREHCKQAKADDLDDAAAVVELFDEASEIALARPQYAWQMWFSDSVGWIGGSVDDDNEWMFSLHLVRRRVEHCVRGKTRILRRTAPEWEVEIVE